MAEKEYIIVRTVEEKYSTIASSKKEALKQQLENPYSVTIIREKVILAKEDT